MLGKFFGKPELRSQRSHLYACPRAKWINGLEFTETAKSGVWERNGYHKRGEPWAEEP